MRKQAGRYSEMVRIALMKCKYQPIKRGCDFDTCAQEELWSRASFV